jgi:tRNA1(Val) A37 N6-methylase TrmN6
MQYETFGLNNIKLYISAEHRFGTDSLLLGEFAIAACKTVVDLCSGCGIIPILLCGETLEKFPKKIYAVEIQKEAANLIRRTVSENNLDFIEVIEQDLRQPLPILRNSVDLVTANPPYYPNKSGFERLSTAERTARHEHDENGCTLNDVVKTASHLLKHGGVLKMCMTASRLAECIGIMQSHSIEPKEIVFISESKTNKARLFLISGKKYAKHGVKVSWKLQTKPKIKS